ncbi:hypothetical protein NVP1083O_57 [Vibrio phage 1.083.O._10N.286.52.B9]|nr:hypothetical protein NVP1083O_57 [Vibrio phage 1.083.O._10N.286.52.B9]
MDRVSETVTLPLKYRGWGEVVDALGDYAISIHVDVNHETILGAINGYDALLVELAFAMNEAIDGQAELINECCSGESAKFTYQGLHDQLFGD